MTECDCECNGEWCECDVSMMMSGVTMSEWYECDGLSGVIVAVGGVTMNDVLL